MKSDLRGPLDLKRPLTFAIDYGTSNSLMVATDGLTVTKPLALDPLATDPSVLRSILYFPHGDACFYGQDAINQYSDHHGEGRLIRSIKKYLPSESYVGSWIDNRVVRLEDLISYFLLEMKKRAEAQLGVTVENVVLGRPAKFSQDPVKDRLAQFRLQKAAELAGFKQISFLPEPLAAALDLRTRLKEMKTVLVVDLGGGTSDFTVIQIGPRAFVESDVLAMGGLSVAGDAVDGEFMKFHVAPFLGSKVKFQWVAMFLRCQSRFLIIFVRLLISRNFGAAITWNFSGAFRSGVSATMIRRSWSVCLRSSKISWALQSSKKLTG
jgi:hypothetical chaperone protein